MNLSRIIIGVVILAAAFIFISDKPEEPTGFVIDREFFTTSDLLYTYEITRYHSNATIIEIDDVENVTIGVTIDTDSISFGKIPGEGSTVKRFVNITNLKEEEASISVSVYGNITPLVKIDRDNFMLKSNEKVILEVLFDTQDFEPGYYDGEIRVVAKRPKYDFLPSGI